MRGSGHCGILLAMVAGAAATPAAAGGLTPKEALARMKVADGLKVSLVASEPMIRQPVSMTFDARGRLWVVQYLQYPSPAGLKPVSVDRYLRTKYDRVPEPPPRGPKGLDRITILEDADGDGAADRAKDFVAGLNLATGLALASDGAYVVQPPYLLFYPDRDRDDSPDGDPEVLLSGFGMEDSHAFANSLQFGPDGWLYGAQGSTVTANIRGVSFQQGIWRYHPKTRAFELFSEGGGNTWGLDFDRHGNVIAGTNWGGHAMLHQVQGAYYVKGFAKHGELHNPHAYGYFDHAPYPDFRGGHVTCGGIVYQGGSLGEKYENHYLAANLLSHCIHWHKIEPSGSTFRNRFGGEVLVADDPWFRPIDCLTGPDGDLYVADWYDQRANHVDPHDDWDKTNGRIYRIEPASGTRREPFDLEKKSNEELIDLLTHRNAWFVREALRLLGERAPSELAERLAKHAREETNPLWALRLFWGSRLAAGPDARAGLAELDSPHADVRAWTVRLLCDRRAIDAGAAERLAKLAAAEPSVTVRCQLAASAKRLPAGQALAIVRELLRREEDARDPFLPLLLWWAVEEKCDGDRAAVVALAEEAHFWDSPIARDVVAPRLARRFAAEGTAADFAAAASLFQFASTDDAQTHLLDGLAKGLAGKRWPNVPAPMRDMVDRLSPRAERDAATLALLVRLGDPNAYRRALARLADRSAPIGERRRLLELFGEVGDEDAATAMLAMLDEPGRPLLKEALAALGRFRSDAIGSQVLATAGKLEGEARSAAIGVLVVRRNWAAALLGAVEAGRLDPNAVPDDALRRMAVFRDPKLDLVIEKVWGRVAVPSPGEKEARVHGIAVSLGMAKGDARRGKEVFAKNCGACHVLFGEGNKIGPELTSADRKDARGLLAHIVDPSAVIRKEYMAYNVACADGRILTGLLVESTPAQITLVDAKNQRTTIAREDIESMEPSAQSLMPEKILDGLDVHQIRDLFRYLQSDAPPN